MERDNLSREQLSDQQLYYLDLDLPDDYYHYDLKGIVIHSGEANSGHYFSYICD